MYYQNSMYDFNILQTHRLPTRHRHREQDKQQKGTSENSLISIPIIHVYSLLYENGKPDMSVDDKRRHRPCKEW